MFFSRGWMCIVLDSLSATRIRGMMGLERGCCRFKREVLREARYGLRRMEERNGGGL